jgi:zinc transport system permease protein
MFSDLIKHAAHWIANQAPPGTMLSLPFMVYALFAVILIGLVCGSVGSLVVGNRMAFFSDALAHCAFAGIALGVLLGVFAGAGNDALSHWITLILVAFGIVMGILIAFLREKTGQASDTVIGVVFAGAIGLGAIVLKAGAAKQYLPTEDFLFGDLVTLDAANIAELVILGLLVGAALILLYNRVVLASFNTSLARSRGVPVRLCSYLFIIVLALIVNVCLRTVGVLLVNALLIVPAATAANVSRNMRQLFAVSIILCILCGVGGLWLSWEVAHNVRLGPGGQQFHPGESGTIVVLAVLLYFISIFIGPRLRPRHSVDGLGTPPAAVREPAG